MRPLLAQMLLGVLLVLISLFFLGLAEERVTDGVTSCIRRIDVSYSIGDNWKEYTLALIGASLLAHGLYTTIKHLRKRAEPEGGRVRH